MTLNKPNGEEIGIISCKIGGLGETNFSWDTKVVLNYCGAGLEGKNKNIEPGDYTIAITKDAEGRPILAKSEQFSIVADETADWQTYTNEEYGFEIKYPSFWSINDKDFPFQTDVRRVTIAEGFYTKEYLAPDDYCFIQFQFEDPISAIDYAVDRGYQQEDVKIAGHPALKLSVKLSNNVEIDDYYIKQNGTYYFGISFYKRGNYSNICNKVFSTLRILK